MATVAVLPAWLTSGLLSGGADVLEDGEAILSAGKDGGWRGVEVEVAEGGALSSFGVPALKGGQG